MPFVLPGSAAAWPRRLARDPYVWIALTTGTVLLVLTYLPLLPASTIEWLNDRWSDSIMLALALLALLTDRSSSRSPEEKSFWRLLAAGLASFLAAELVDAFSWFGSRPGEPLLARSILFIGLYVFTCIALEFKPHAPHREPGRWLWRRRLEATGVVLLGLGLFVYFSLLPEIDGTSSAALSATTSLLYSVFDVYLLVRILQLFGAARDSPWRLTYLLLAGVFVFWLAADLVEAAAWMGWIAPLAFSRALDALWLPPYLGLVLAARSRAAALAASEQPATPPADDDQTLEDLSAWAVWRRPLWLQALALPAVHQTLDSLGLLSASVESAQQACAFAVALAIGALALADQRRLEAESRVMEAERRAAREAELRAHRDALTGLPNRFLLLDHLGLALAQSHREGSRVGIAYLDLDRFKVINDSLGHLDGDLVLRAIATRLQSVVRSGDTLGRIGGDELVLVLPRIPGPTEAVAAVQKLLGELRRPLVIGGVELSVTASAGLVVYPDDGEAAEDLLRRADRAMMLAKEQGGDRLVRAELDQDSGELRTLDLETCLRKGLDEDAFSLVYQPVCDLATGRAGSCEALLRWCHPTKGRLSPGEFLGVAESIGVLSGITPWLLMTACREAASWSTGNAGGAAVSVNLSARQFLDPELLPHIRRALRETGLDGRLLQIEITESIAMAQPDRMAHVLFALRELGVRIAIDDFGTGHSSLVLLRLLPVDTLKIDASFVRGIDHSPADAAIITAILAMARALGLETVAEGVERRSERDFLIGQGCRLAQGYLFSPPLEPQSVPQFFARRSARAD